MTDQASLKRRTWRTIGAVAATVAMVGALGVGSFALTQPNDGGSETSAPKVGPQPPANEPPSAVVTAQTSDLTVTVDASASTDVDGEILIYVWDFGDETIGTQAVTSHTYASAGSYTVTVTVTDDDGDAATAETTVSVTDPPPPPPPPSSGDPNTCPPWTYVNSGDNSGHTSCAPVICRTLTLPDPAHPECDYFHPPSYYW